MAEEELYCTCKQPADDRFMIACDKCEEWYHGECINILESDSANIKYYYCAACRTLDPSLKTKYRKNKENKSKKDRKEKKDREKHRDRDGKKKKRRVEIFNSDDEGSPEHLSHFKPIEKKKKMDPADVFGGDSPDDDLAFENFVSKEIKQPKIEPTKSEPLPNNPFIKDDFNLSPPEDDSPQKKPPKRKFRDSDPAEQPHCLGLKCVNPARKKSKYCSDQCGRNLAAQRIKFLLPKIEQMKEHPSVATIEQYYRLEKLKLKYQSILELRNDLETKFNKLEDVIIMAKKKSIVPPENDEEQPSEDPMIFCFVCGHLRPSKTLIEHIDKCYRRVEAETSYGSIFETKVEGSKRLFCDAYNNNTKAFCKRLKVMCAEHSKDPKPDDNEVCGCPLNPETFYEMELNTIATCRTAKKLCRKHLLWEKMYRAEIDLKRIRALIKLDQNLEERKKLENGINNRLGAALLLLNNTIHEQGDIYDLRSDERKAETREIEEKLTNEDIKVDV